MRVFHRDETRPNILGRSHSSLVRVLVFSIAIGGSGD